jgi:ABC-type transporter Mla maintaining outer membrane lipid asymmetry ATPase subunit MlaF
MKLATTVLEGAQDGMRTAARAVARTAQRRPLLLAPEESLPVAGLDPLAAQAIHYTLSSLEGVRA